MKIRGSIAEDQLSGHRGGWGSVETVVFTYACIGLGPGGLTTIYFKHLNSMLRFQCTDTIFQINFIH